MTNRKSKVFRSALSPGLILSVTGCMHGLMPTGGRDHPPEPDAVVVQELVRETISATATFPPLIVGRESRISVRIYDATGSRPIREVVVVPEISITKQSSGQSMEHMRGGDPSPSTHSRLKTTEGQKIPEGEIQRERGEQGEIIFSFLPRSAGEYRVAIHVTSVNGILLEPAIVLDAIRNATEFTAGPSGGLFGSDDRGADWAIGGLVMGAMMVSMWIW